MFNKYVKKLNDNIQSTGEVFDKEIVKDIINGERNLKGRVMNLQHSKQALESNEFPSYTDHVNLEQFVILEICKTFF